MLAGAPYDIKFRRTFRDLVGPLAGSLLVLIVAPAALPLVLINLAKVQLPAGLPSSCSARLIPFTPTNHYLISVRSIYPSLFVGAALVNAIGRIGHQLDVWAINIRDNEYLLHLRLQNLEDKEARQANGRTAKGKGGVVGLRHKHVERRAREEL
jgi:hypothetical protein